MRKVVLDRKQLVQSPWGRKDLCKGLAGRLCGRPRNDSVDEVVDLGRDWRAAWELGVEFITRAYSGIVVKHSSKV